jgi:hypothetical protein
MEVGIRLSFFESELSNNALPPIRPAAAGKGLGAPVGLLLAGCGLPCLARW